MKLIFLDIDGTLLDHDVLHDIPTSAKKAISETRKKGNKVILCTGRSKSNVPNDLIDFEVDAAVYAAGAHIEVKGQLIESHVIEKQKVIELDQELDQLAFGVVLEGPCIGFCNALAIKHFEVINKNYTLQSDEQGMNLHHDLYLPIKDFSLYNYDINKLTFYANDEIALKPWMNKYSELYEFSQHKTDANGYTCYECCLKGINKGRAMKVLVNYYQASLSDTYAYGDSMNDYSMILQAHVGVAMGNGVEALKQVADVVCGKVSEDGLYLSFKTLGLI